jgi:hypothetical protein
MKYVKLFEDWTTTIDNTHIGHWLAKLEHFLISQNIEVEKFSHNILFERDFQPDRVSIVLWDGGPYNLRIMFSNKLGIGKSLHDVDGNKVKDLKSLIMDFYNRHVKEVTGNEFMGHKPALRVKFINEETMLYRVVEEATILKFDYYSRPHGS